MTPRRPLAAPLLPALLIAFALTAFALTACSSDKNASLPSSGASASSSSAPSKPRPLRILVSNDDGVDAPGIDALVQALVAEPDVTVTVVAPAHNQSDTGGKTTASSVPASEAKTRSGYPAVAVDGFPADAVIRGLTLSQERPDIVIAGTNAGQNIGPWIDRSGTVGAARAAAQRGIPALAVSAGLGDPIDYATATSEAIRWLREHRAALVASPPPPPTVENLNAPTCTAGHERGVVETSPDTTVALGDALAPADCTSTESQPSSDVAAFHAGFATLSMVPVTP